jgi:hypothetical protein
MFAAKNEGFPNLHRSGQSALTAVFEVVMILPSSRPTVCAAPVPPGRIIEVVQDLQEMGNHRPINTKNHTSQTVSAHCFFFNTLPHTSTLQQSVVLCSWRNPYASVCQANCQAVQALPGAARRKMC